MELAASILWYLALAAAALYVFLFPGASRWIILVAILIFTGAELVVYFTVRYAVFLLERFRQPFRRHAALRRAVRTGEGCDDYASWRSRAEELDRVDGRERWKTAPGGPYNAPLIAGLHADLKEAMRRVEAAMAAQEAVAPAPALAQAPATATSASARAQAARARARARALGLGGADGSDALSCLGVDSEDELWAGAGGSDAEGDQSFGSLFGSREGSATGGLSRDDDDDEDDEEDDEDLTSENEEKVSHKPVFRTRKPAVAHEASQTGSMLALGGAAGLPPLTRAASASKGSPLPQTDAPKTTPPLSKLQLALPVSATTPAMEVKPPSSDAKPRAEGADEGEGPPPPSLLSCILSPGGALQPLPPGQEAEPEPLQLPTTAASAGGVVAPPATEPAPALVAQVPTVTSEDGTEPGSAPAVLSHSTDVSVETREREPEREKTASSVGPPVSEDDGASAFSVASTVPASISSAISAASTAPAASIGSAISAASTAGTGGSTSPSRALASALRDLRTLLQLSARHNVGGTMSESLYSHTNTGTKRAVEDFLATVADATRLLARAPALPAQLRLKALTALRRTHGHTALCLSGGGGLGQYHTGVVRTLLAQGLLPRVISGTSAGALVAAHVCCRTDEELKESLRGESFAEYMGFDNGLSWFQKAAAWFKRGHVFDPAHWDKLVNWHCAGDLTFQEAYERTGRTLVITATSTHQHEPPLMLSRLTTPRVLVSSAIVASASVPGLLPLATLREKAPDGTVRECKAPFRDLRDGSFKSDIPMSELAFYCNANYFIVSQVNPHIAPFFFFSQGDAGRGVGRWAGWRGGYLLSFLESLLKHDMRKNLAVLRDMGMLPTIMGADWSFLFLQPFGGHVTLVPPIRLRDYVHIIDAPSVEESDRYFKDGELMVWRKTTLIETRVRFGKVLVEEMERLRAEIGGKSCPEGEDDAGAAAAPAEPLVPAALMDQVPATD